MKYCSRTALTILLGAVLLMGSGCASNLYPGGPTPAGILYTEVTAPAQYLTVAIDKDAKSEKKGEASAFAVLGLFAFGDAGIDAAMRNGGITRVHHVDHTVQHFLYALYVRDKTIVYGE